MAIAGLFFVGFFNTHPRWPPTVLSEMEYLLEASCLSLLMMPGRCLNETSDYSCICVFEEGVHKVTEVPLSVL